MRSESRSLHTGSNPTIPAYDAGDGSFGKVAAESIHDVIRRRDDPPFFLAESAFDRPYLPTARQRRAGGDGCSVKVHVATAQRKCFANTKAAASHQTNGDGSPLVDGLGGADDGVHLIVGERTSGLR
jgi:hypothetical protein